MVTSFLKRPPANDWRKCWHKNQAISAQCRPPLMGNLCSAAPLWAGRDLVYGAIDPPAQSCFLPFSFHGYYSPISHLCSWIYLSIWFLGNPTCDRERQSQESNKSKRHQGVALLKCLSDTEELFWESFSLAPQRGIGKASLPLTLQAQTWTTLMMASPAYCPDAVLSFEIVFTTIWWPLPLLYILGLVSMFYWFPFLYYLLDPFNSAL